MSDESIIKIGNNIANMFIHLFIVSVVAIVINNYGGFSLNKEIVDLLSNYIVYLIVSLIMFSIIYMYMFKFIYKNYIEQLRIIELTNELQKTEMMINIISYNLVLCFLGLVMCIMSVICNVMVSYFFIWTCLVLMTVTITFIKVLYTYLNYRKQIKVK